jgi:hypothetical protein
MSGRINDSLSLASGACLEVASQPAGMIGVRYSKGSPVLRFTTFGCKIFIGGVRNIEFDNFPERNCCKHLLTAIGMKAPHPKRGSQLIAAVSSLSCER